MVSDTWHPSVSVTVAIYVVLVPNDTVVLLQVVQLKPVCGAQEYMSGPVESIACTVIGAS
jgi:hypothetical protein